MRRRILRAASALCVLAMTASCGNGGTKAVERPRSTATIKIAQPEANAVITNPSFTVRLDLDGGRIAKVVSQDLTPDEGHVHVSIDGKIISQTFGVKERVEAPKKGRHLLQAEFVAKDHGPFMPRVLDAIPFMVR